MINKALELEDILADGLIGLGPNPPPGKPYNTLLQQFYNQKLVKFNLFTLYLGKAGTQSTIWIGGYDP